MPKRIQRKRTKGWRMPPNTVSICRPGKWGNPFEVTEERPAAVAKTAFLLWLTGDIYAGLPEQKQWILDNIHLLRSKDLACDCREDEPCHGDVLLELANK